MTISQGSGLIDLQETMNKLNVLVTGGAGYIGSHMVKMLGQHGCDVTVVDNLSTGHKDAVTYGDFVEGNIGDRQLLASILDRHFDVVLHFAACSEVAESIEHPGKYFDNNVVNTLHLLDTMLARGVKRLVFSSSAAVYGDPVATLMNESHRLQPVNPYGRSKLMIEQVLTDYDRAYGLKSVSLRYFNAAGADPDGDLGERHEPETHLIPLVLRAASGRHAGVKVFGRDYDTPDGSCIRDYIHVTDVCAAHWLAVQSLMNGADSQVLNLGNGNGYSVQQVIETAQRVTGRPIAVEDAARRDGDPARLVADSDLARHKLGWKPQYPELDTMIAHAWNREMRSN